MKISQITEVIERFAPLGWQESYDNAGLIVGRPDDEVHKALLAVDVTEEVLDEADTLPPSVHDDRSNTVCHPLHFAQCGNAHHLPTQSVPKPSLYFYHLTAS